RQEPLPALARTNRADSLRYAAPPAVSSKRGASDLERFRILFVGDLSPYLTTAARRDALIELGVPVESIDSRAFGASRSRLVTAIAYRSLLTPGIFAFNREILARADRVRPDVIWFEKPTLVFPRTFQRLRREYGALMVYHNTDDWK